MTAAVFHAPVLTKPRVVVWSDLILILALALTLRVVLFNGAFGSDDGTYYQRALEIANGQWTSANYNGALRYGFNLPAGLLMAVFGTSIFAANLWSLLCSLVEIAAVWRVALELLGRRGAVTAALLLASAPLHIAVGTRIHADPVVAAFLTLAYAFLFFGLRGRSALQLFAAGLCLGAVYWVKELAAVTWVALVPMLWFVRGYWRSVVWVVSGALLMFALNCLLMTIVSGDPFHLIRVVTGALKNNFIDGGGGEDSASYYLRYLFVDVRHVATLGWLALLAGALPLLARRLGDTASGGLFVTLWLVGLLLVLSLFPVSLSPLRLTMKQSNYISLFLAPLALAAAYTLSRLSVRAGSIALAASAAAGVMLAMLQQADYRAFTGNSKALVEAVKAQPSALWIGSTNNAALGTTLTRMDGTRAALMSFREVLTDPEEYRRRSTATDRVLAVIDPQTANWFAGPSPVNAPLPCWQLQGELAPADLALGNRFAGLLGSVFTSFDVPLARKAGALFDALAHPLPARIYRVQGSDVWCGTH